MRETTTKVKKTMELIKEDEDWAQEMFPGVSSYWLHQRLMEAFRATVEQDGMEKFLDKYVRRGAEEVKALFNIDENGQ